MNANGSDFGGQWASTLNVVFFPKKLQFHPTTTVGGRLYDLTGQTLINQSLGGISTDERGDFSLAASNAESGFTLGGVDVPAGFFNHYDLYLNTGGETTQEPGIMPKPPNAVVQANFTPTEPSTENYRLVDDGQSEIQPIQNSPGIYNLNGRAVYGIAKDDFQTLWFPLEHATRVAFDLLSVSSFEVNDNSDNDVSELHFLNKDGEPLSDAILADFDLSSIPGTQDAHVRTINNIDLQSELTLLHPRLWTMNLTNMEGGKRYDLRFSPKMSDIELGAGSATGQIDILVIDQNGDLVPNAPVAILSDGEILSTESTNADGLAQLPAPLSDSAYILAGKTIDGLERFVVSSAPGASLENGARLVLNVGPLESSRPFTGTLSGRITAPMQIENALVEVTFGGTTQSLRVGEDGGFSFVIGTSGNATSVALKFRHPFLIELEQNYTIRDDSNLEVVLRPLAFRRGFSGRVTDIYDSGLPNVPIFIDWELAPFQIATSNSDGKYSFSIPEDWIGNSVYLDAVGYEKTFIFINPDGESWP
ncbi:MAG: hypothetical protein AAFQ37_12180, partial [Bacteroidota bacterium]